MRGGVDQPLIPSVFSRRRLEPPREDVVQNSDAPNPLLSPLSPSSRFFGSLKSQHESPPAVFTTEGTETPVRAARKEAFEIVRFAQPGHNSPGHQRTMPNPAGVALMNGTESIISASSFRAPRRRVSVFSVVLSEKTVPPRKTFGSTANCRKRVAA